MKKRLVKVAFIVVVWLCLVHDATAQNRPVPKVGVLWGLGAVDAVPYQQTLAESMRRLGWVEGRNFQFVLRYMEGDQARVPAIIAEFVKLKVDVLYLTDQAIAAAQAVTRTIPIVCSEFYDPIDEGFTTSFAKPSQNVTGVSWQSIGSAAKRVDLATDLVPGLKNIAFLYEATDRGALIEKKGVTSAARTAKVQLNTFPFHDSRSLQRAFAAMKSSRPDVLIVSVNNLTWTSREEIASFASSIKLPAISEVAEFAKAGFLLTYGVNMLDAHAKGASYLNRILRGAKPSDLPFQQPTTFDFVVNMKTAKVLGIKIPESILLRATEVIR